MKANDGLAELDCKVLHETTKAYKVEIGGKEHWVPKSMVKDYCEESDGTISSIFVPEWFATKEGMV